MIEEDRDHDKYRGCKNIEILFLRIMIAALALSNKGSWLEVNVAGHSNKDLFYVLLQSAAAKTVQHAFKAPVPNQPNSDVMVLGSK